MADTEHQPVDLHQIFRVLLRRKMLLVLPWALALTAGLCAAFLLRPIYFSTVTLQLERPQALSGALGGMVGGSNPEQQADIMREQVQSSVFLRSVLNSTGIKNDPATRAWAVESSKKYRNLSGEEKIDAFLVDYLRGAVQIRRGRGNIFQVTVADYQPERAQRFAAGVANQFVISSKAAQIEAVRATQEFSIEQQAIAKKKLEESEARLEAARRSVITSSMTGSSVTETNLGRARSLLDQADLDVEEQRNRVEQLKHQLAGVVQENDADQLTSAETRTLMSQLNGLERQLASSQLVSDAGGDGASARPAIARAASDLELKFAQNAAIAFPNLPAETRDLLVRYRLAQADFQAKTGRRAYLAGQVGGYQQRQVMAPDRDMELQRLTQEVENNRAFYNAFLQQSAAAQIAEAFENAKVSGRFVVLEPATLPRSPGKPNRPMLILLSLVVGGVIGIGSVLITEQHDQSVRNAEEVESLLGLPVLGAVPRVEELERSRRRSRSPAPGVPGIAGPRDTGLLHRLKTESPLGLEFRRIYLKLAKSRGRTLPSTLLITSSTRGEGKTTTSACLAITLARELNEKLLLVDFDLRSPALHRALGLPSSSWGLAQMLHQQKFDERFVRSTVLQNLDFLPAGKSERPASELIDSETVEWFLQEALKRYPLVVVDSAPNLAVPDPLIIGRAVEGVLYVLKAGTTVRKAAEFGVKVQREARDNVIGVLLNDAGEILPHYYGYHDAYGYTTEVAGGES
jgi:capsular exopolysaccharide synthesis family protein